MDKRIDILRKNMLDKKHHIYRKKIDDDFAEQCHKRGLAPILRISERFCAIMRRETPVILEGEKIVFTRTVKNLPRLFTEKEWDDIKKEHFIHELGYVCNITPDYAHTIRTGLLERKKRG